LIRAIALALLILGLTSTGARADFVFTVTMPSTSTGTVDFNITSNDSATLSAFGLQLMISPTSSATTLASFSSTQTDPFSNSGYVFAGQSFNSDNGLPFWSLPFMTTTPNDSILGGDSADPSVGPGFVTVLSSPSYLGTVQFEGPSASAGQQFQITLGGGSTSFDDRIGNSLSYTASFTPSAGGGGTVNIDISTASVPEPSSLAMAGISSLVGLLVYRRSRR
jgi:hypothetical protein